MNNLHIRQQHAVTDPLQRERLLRALKIILEPSEKTNASNPLCQGLNAPPPRLPAPTTPEPMC